MEDGGGGSDDVRAGTDWTMTAGQEIETVRAFGNAATAGVSLMANELGASLIGGSGVDHLTGGAGIDRLDGKGGADVMAGGGDDDAYFVDDAGDQVMEGSTGGSDNVRASTDWTMTAGQQIETLRAFGAGATSGVMLGGNELANRLVGGDGKDTICGGLGNDILKGGADDDVFLFDSALRPANVDRIVGFEIAGDSIALDDAILRGLTGGTLNAAAFSLATATGSAAQVVYDHATGGLYFDSNGMAAGGSTRFATVAGAPALDHSFFTVV
jgi:serralysin